MVKRLLKILALVRSLVYAAFVVGPALVFLPGQILDAAGIVAPTWIGPTQVAGLELLALGTALALWSIVMLAFVGNGTHAPFDPPRKLVVAGPYRWVRNPLYLGAGLVLIGTGLYFQAAALGAVVAAFFLAAHLFVVFHEEPTLERTFGAQYSDYANAVPRWLPRWRAERERLDELGLLR